MIQGFFLTIVFAGLFGFAVHVWASTPVVQFSWSTQQCVKVVFGDGSCDNLPKKYEKEWIK